MSDLDRVVELQRRIAYEGAAGLLQSESLAHYEHGATWLVLSDEDRMKVANEFEYLQMTGRLRFHAHPRPGFCCFQILALDGR